ncbi:MAG: hypothetical protein MUC96_06180 [Myxococcaceae bacterium]|jgi:hypothetical protein|nr:hypothetical protein [Myxococcaceae bacterium]
MSKLLLLSIVVGLVVIPIWAAREPHPLRAMRLALLGLAVLHVGYALFARFVLPRIAA